MTHDNNNIYCIWYPSGGFGHFINAVATLYGADFVRPRRQKYEFSATGNSHDCELTADKFVHNPTDYRFAFEKSHQQYSVLIDNGINDESEHWVKIFPHAKIIKVSYSDRTWPIVASTMIHKALMSDLATAAAVDLSHWPSHDAWAQREKYFLFLTQHHCRTMWKPQPGCHNLSIDDLLRYDVFCSKLHKFGVATTDFSQLWQHWLDHNNRYIDPVLFADTVLDAVSQGQSMDISHCVDLWTQAVVNYQIWQRFHRVVPANDCADWFRSTDQIVALLSQRHALH